MVKVSTPRITVTGVAKSERVYVAVQEGTAVVSSSEKVTVHAPGQRPAVIELREDKAGTLQDSDSAVTV